MFLRQTQQTEVPTGAKKKVKYEFAGIGALVQCAGFIALFIFPIGTIAGVILLVIGSNLSKKFLCSECGNIVE